MKRIEKYTSKKHSRINAFCFTVSRHRHKFDDLFQQSTWTKVDTLQAFVNKNALISHVLEACYCLTPFGI